MPVFKRKHSGHNAAERVIPTHIAVIMDGNGRWAKKRGMPRFAGHKVGASTFKDVCRYFNALGVKYATFYAFSTENWKRPQKEVDAIMDILREYLRDADNYKDENIRIRFIGDRSRLDDDIRKRMKEAEESSADATGTVVIVAINYGGRDELVHAAREMARECAGGKLSCDGITEETMSHYLYTDGCPDVDLLIRPGGEYRISNYLLWQCAYAEFWFTNTLWPDFSRKEIDRAIEDFSHRQRRFGDAK